MSTTAHLDPSEQITHLDAMAKQIGRRVADLRLEIDDITLQWEGLQAIGGAREDHAAHLLSCLQAHLCGLAHFCATADVQIQQMHENPFGN